MSLYFIAIEPHPELVDKIKIIQKDFAERFNSEKAYKNFPHITIIPPFQYHESNEAEIIGKFMKIPMCTKSFEVILDGFSSFQNKKNHVIYIKPKNLDKLKDLFKEVNETMNCFNYAEHFNPHLTIAYRDLSPEKFDIAWQEYKDKTFDDHFVVEKVSLYKHFNGKWNEIAHKSL